MIRYISLPKMNPQQVESLNETLEVLRVCWNKASERMYLKNVYVQLESLALVVGYMCHKLPSAKVII